MSALVLLAGCGQDPSGPTTASEVLPIDGTAGVKQLSGAISINLVATSVEATGVLQPFETLGKKLTDFALVADEIRNPQSTMVFTKLGAGDYTFQAEPIEGFTISQIICESAEAGTAFDQSIPSTVTVHLAKKSLVRCFFFLGSAS